MAPELILLPLPLIAVAVSIEYRTEALSQPIVEVAIVPIAIARNVDSFSVNLVSVPLTVIDRAVLE